MSLTISRAGPFTLLVDRGRLRSRSLGVPVGGAADQAAWALANSLVGNPADAVALEFTLSGPEIVADVPIVCGLFGAAFRGEINGTRTVHSGCRFRLAAGDRLRIGGTPTGMRGYLAVAGGIEAPRVLGSASSLSPLEAETKLAVRSADATGIVSLPFSHFPEPSPVDRPTTLRAVDGPQCPLFEPEHFFHTVYEVTPASDRMGIRLSGKPLARPDGELISEPVAPGAVQITNDGLPVILGVDGQTIGGYPKVAHVVRADLDKLAQLRPGERVQFQRLSWEEAEEAQCRHRDELAEWCLRARLRADVRLL